LGTWYEELIFDVNFIRNVNPAFMLDKALPKG
jgi:hypothetical protein